MFKTVDTATIGSKRRPPDALRYLQARILNAHRRTPGVESVAELDYIL